MTKLKAGVAGVGHIGKLHARILSESADAEFAAIYDSNHDAAKKVAEQYGARPVESLEELAACVDAVTVATPTPTHFEIGKFLLERGRHLLIEKPITETTQQARELVALAHERGASSRSDMSSGLIPCSARWSSISRNLASSNATGFRPTRTAAWKSASCST